MLARLFIFFGGLLVAALTAALIAPYFVNWTGYRADFEREASRIVGQRVQVRGEATARILPFPSLSFSDVVIDGPDGLPALTASAFSMDAELAPFLSGQVLIFDMRLEQPDVRLALDSSGGLIWPMPERDGEAPPIAVERLTISGGRLLLERRDAPPVILTDVAATVSTASLDGPWKADGTASVNGSALGWTAAANRAPDDTDWRLRLAVTPDDGPLSAELDGRLAVSEGAPVWKGDAVIDLWPPRRGTDAQRIARINGPFTATAAGISIDDARLAAGPAGSPYSADGTMRVMWGAEPSFAVALEGQQLRLDELDGTEKGDRLGEADPSGTLLGERLGALAAFADMLPVPAIQGTVDVSLPALVAGTTTVRNLAVKASPGQGGWTVDAFSGELPGRTVVEGSGALEKGTETVFRGAVTVASRQPTGLAAWLGLPADEALHALSGGGFSARVEVSAGRQVLRDLELQLGEARFRGFIDRQAQPGLRPTLAISLTGTDADLDVASGGWMAGVAAGHDLDIAFQAEGVSALGLSADRLDAAFAVANGLIEIDTIGITGFEGAQVSAKGQWPLEPMTPGGRIDLDIVAADPAAAHARLVGRFPDAPAFLLAGDRLALHLATAQDLNARVSLESGAEGLRADVVAESRAGRVEARIASPDVDLSSVTATAAWDAPAAGPLLLLLDVPDFGLGATGAMRAEADVAGAPGAWGGDVRLIAAGGARLDLTLDPKGAAAPFLLEATDAEPFLLAAGYGLPGGGLGLPLSAKGAWQLTPEGVSLRLDRASLAGSGFSGDISIKRGTRDTLTGALAFPALDLAGAGLAAFTGLTGEAGPTPDLPFDADLKLEVAALTLTGGSMVEALSSRLIVEPARISLRDVKGTLHTGALEAGIDLLRANGVASVTANGTLEGFALERLAPGLVSGAASARFEFSASAATPDAVARALSGTVVARSEGLELVRVSPSGFAALIAATDGRDSLPDAGEIMRAARGLYTQSGSLTGPFSAVFSISSGVMRAPQLSLDLADGGSIEIAPSLDLATGLTDTTGAIYAAGSRTPLRFALDGPWTAPQVSLDVSALESEITQRALDREQARVEALQSALVEKQRLRRENRHFEGLIAARRAAEEARLEAERLRLEAEAAERLKQEAEAAESLKQEAEAAERLKQEAEAGRPIRGAAPAPAPASP